MNLKFLQLIIIAGLLDTTLPAMAQTNGLFPFGNQFRPNQVPFNGVQFVITVSNKTFSAGSTNPLRCVISNLTSNKIIMTGNLPSISFLYLTNSLGKFLRYHEMTFLNIVAALASKTTRLQRYSARILRLLASEDGMSHFLFLKT